MASKQLLESAQIAAAMRGFQTAFDSTIAQYQDPITQLAMQIQSSADTEEYDWIGDVPGLQEWLDGRPYSKLTAKMMRIVNRQFASGLKVKRTDIINDKLGMVMPRINSLAQKAAQFPSWMLGQMLLNGHAGVAGLVDWSDGKSWDASYYFVATHPWGSSTYSNVGTAALALASLKAAVVVMTSYVDEEGRYPLGVRPTHLIVGPSLEWTARSLVAPVTTIVDTSAIAIPNPYAGMQVIVSPTFVSTYAAYWCLADLSQPIKPLIQQNREAPRFTSLTDGDLAMDEDIFKYGADGMWGFGYGEPHYCWGSDGTT